MRNRVLITMLEIYRPEGVDWMNCKMTSNNPYTYHHIIKKCDLKRCGENCNPTLENGAILTRKAHDKLNRIEELLPHYYNKLNALFKNLNGTELPPTSSYYSEVNDLLKEIDILLASKSSPKESQKKKDIILSQLIAIYNPEEVDWMNYQITKENTLMYEPIYSSQKKDRISLSNGAILTRKAHQDLMVIKDRLPSYYRELRKLFIWLNETGLPPTNEYYKNLNDLLDEINHLLHENENQKNNYIRKKLIKKQFKR